jgi:hypothetical protein
MDFSTIWHHPCPLKKGIERKKEADKAKYRVPMRSLPAVTGRPEQTCWKVNHGERKLPRICGKFRTNHAEYPF